MSKEAAKKGLELTLMERVLLMWKKDEDVVRMLKTQYRMHEEIMQWSSDAMYEGMLKAHHSVSKHLLRDIEEVNEDENTSTYVNRAGENK